MKRNQKRRHYFEPHLGEDDAPLCEAEGCFEKGYFKAPKTPGKRDYLHFCLTHVQEYNASWNYYRHMNGADVEENTRLDSIWRRPTWNFKHKERIRSPYEIEDPLLIFGMNGFARPQDFSKKHLTREQKQAIETMQLAYPFSKKELKAAYIKLVKKHHPDVNKGSKRSEEKLKKISESYDILNRMVK